MFPTLNRPITRAKSSPAILAPDRAVQANPVVQANAVAATKANARSTVKANEPMRAPKLGDTTRSKTGGRATQIAQDAKYAQDMQDLENMLDPRTTQATTKASAMEQIPAPMRNKVTMKQSMSDGGSLPMQEDATGDAKSPRRGGASGRSKLLKRNQALTFKKDGDSLRKNRVRRDFGRSLTKQTGGTNLQKADKLVRHNPNFRSRQLTSVRSEVRFATQATSDQDFTKACAVLFRTNNEGSVLVARLKKQEDVKDKLATFAAAAASGRKDNFSDATIAKYYKAQVAKPPEDFGKSISRDQMIKHFKPAMEDMLKALADFEMPDDIKTTLNVASQQIRNDFAENKAAGRPMCTPDQLKVVLNKSAINILSLRLLQPAVGDALLGRFAPANVPDAVSKTAQDASTTIISTFVEMANLQAFPTKLFNPDAGAALRGSWQRYVEKFASILNGKMGDDMLTAPPRPPAPPLLWNARGGNQKNASIQISTGRTTRPVAPSPLSSPRTPTSDEKSGDSSQASGDEQALSDAGRAHSADQSEKSEKGEKGEKGSRSSSDRSEKGSGS